MITFEQKTSSEIALEVAGRVRARRKELKLTQAQLACRAGMSLASYKRFEQRGQVAFESLVSIALALDCEQDFDALFARRAYASIEEVIAEASHGRKTHKGSSARGAHGTGGTGNSKWAGDSA
jgi:transcriptional regulator with XRE-family HTH domain